MDKNINLITAKLCDTPRKNKLDNIVTMKENVLNITYCEDDIFETFELELNKSIGNSFFLHKIKRKISNISFSFLSVFIIMTAFICASIYEDFMKKIIFEMPFLWDISDAISLFFVILFFLGLVKIPSILDGESSELKNILTSWFNKEARKCKKLNMIFANIKPETTINLFNIDLVDSKHWVWKILMKALLKKFINVNIYIRHDQQKDVTKNIKTLTDTNINICNKKKSYKNCDVDILLSSHEQKMYALLQLSSSFIIESDIVKTKVSLEFFEYMEQNILEKDKNDSQHVIKGLKNFIHRSFDDFYFLKNDNTNICFTPNVKLKNVEDEQRRLAYYLKNHIEECVDFFDEPISLLILYYYVKEIVIDKTRLYIILEKFINMVAQKQQYKFIKNDWFKIAGEMFDPTNLNEFQLTNISIYRKLSISSLSTLLFLLERNGCFEEALKLANYLYEINPNKFALDICSLYERMGKFDEAFESLPKSLHVKTNKKPTDIVVRYLQRKSWIIVSQRKMDKKIEGQESLKQLHNLLFSHNEDNEPLWLWHYYNSKANYHEWNEEYTLAIKNYKKCLSIPALGAFEYGATFINISIAFRYKFINSSRKAMSIIDESIRLGKIGVDLKESVGDRDEMPVVLHNQSLNILYKYSFFESETQDIEKVKLLTDEGLKILNETNSTKRLGMLLIENYISKVLLGLENENIKENLEKNWIIMDENEKEQVLVIFNLYKNKPLFDGIALHLL